MGAAPSVTATHVTPTFQNFPGPSNLASDAGEPSIGVNLASGAVLFQSYTKTLRVTFDDSTPIPTASWVSKKPLTSIINIDPILSTDTATGRTFAGGLDGECSILSYTDDDGQTWTQMTNACASPAFDHETIGSGPWKSPAPLGATYNRAVYYCAQYIVAECATSWNGGLTFNNPTTVIGLCQGLHGHVKVAPNGTAFLPFKSCSGRVGLGYTTDNGLNWASRVVPASTPNSIVAPQGFDPSVAIAPNGTLYLAWQGRDNHPMVAVSSNEGRTYYHVKDLSTTYGTPIVQSTFQAAVVGDNDRAAVAFLGSTTPGDPFTSGWPGVWDLYVSFTYDGGAAWTTVKATTDPVQRGWMCAGGISCNSGRNLLDFMDATVDARGRVLVGYADGCLGCASAAQSTASLGTIARQSGGSGLYAAFH